MTMGQLLVECSDPGLVVSLAEEFENVLRRIDFDRARARYPTVKHRWVRDSVQQLEKALQEVNTRAEAVMEYELDRQDPASMEPCCFPACEYRHERG